METRTVVEVEEMELDELQKEQALRYQPSHVRPLFQALRRLRPYLGEATFVDLGCGKGRALMLASLMGARACVGVEMDPGLIERCGRNLERFCRRTRVGRDRFRLVAGHVLDFSLDTHPSLVYLFNPFPPEVMKRLFESWQLEPEDRVLCMNPTAQELLYERGLECLQEFPHENPNKLLRLYGLNRQRG